MAYKQQPKSPMLKALKGNQGKLPQHLQAAIKAAPESPAKATMAPAPKAKPKYDKELNTLVASRKGLKKGTAEYNTVQNQINKKLGSSVRRRTEETTKIAPKKAKTTSAPKVNTTLPAKPTAAAAKPKAKTPKAKTPKVRTIGGGAAKGGSTTLTVKTGGGANKGGSTKRETVTKNSKKVVTKTAGTRTVEKTNKDGSSSTKTTKRIGKGRIKGAIKNARLARLDKKATRQAAKAADKKSKGADKLSGLDKSPAKNYKKGYYGV